VEDRFNAAAKRMKRLAPIDTDKKLVQEVIDKLEATIAERQKHIRITDSSRF